MAEPKIVVASGWWSPGSRSQWNIGDDLIRSTQFFALWHRQVMKSFDPIRILVTDSYSPNKPEWRKFDKVEWLQLDRNYGHSNDIRTGIVSTKFSGISRSRLLGALYALCCDADYYVYVEQDCLVRGIDFINVSIGHQEFDFFCGQRTEQGKGLHGNIALPMLQNSVLIMKRRGMERYISNTISSPETDGELSSELKMERDMAPFGTLLVPYGRSRPIDFSRSHLYAQHFTREELTGFLEAEGLEFNRWFPDAGG